MEFPKRFVCECAAHSTYEKHIPAPLFRKSFFLPEGERGGEILITGLGFYDLFLNGNKIAKREADAIRLEVTCPEAVDCRLVLDSGYVFAETENARAGSGAGTYRIRKGN